VRTRAAVFLLLAWHVLAAALVGTAIATAVVLYRDELAAKTVGVGYVLLVCASMWLAFILPASLFFRRRAELPFYASSVSLADGPDSVVWPVVRDVAAAVGVTPPRVVRLTSEANARVVEEPRLMGLLPGARTLHVGVPLLVALPDDQLRAVLGHELAHLARGHSRFTAVVYRGAAALRMSELRVRLFAKQNPAMGVLGAQIPVLLIRAYSWLYHGVAFAALREHETAADDAAARSAGAAVTREALAGQNAVERAWRDFMVRVAPFGRGPADRFEAFRLWLAEPEMRELLPIWREHPISAPVSWFDAHPGLGDRLVRLGGMPGGEAVVEEGAPLAPGAVEAVAIRALTSGAPGTGPSSPTTNAKAKKRPRKARRAEGSRTRAWIVSLLVLAASVGIGIAANHPFVPRQAPVYQPPFPPPTDDTSYPGNFLDPQPTVSGP
jgi:Zn-dependent protease with chaperone function